jgi:hypothetical protein
VLLTKTIKQVNQIHLLVAPAPNAADLVAFQKKLVKKTYLDSSPLLQTFTSIGGVHLENPTRWIGQMDWVSMTIAAVEIYLCLYSFQDESKLRILAIL